MNTNYLKWTFINVLLTLVFIYIIRMMSYKFDIPFLKNVVAPTEEQIQKF